MFSVLRVVLRAQFVLSNIPAPSNERVAQLVVKACDSLNQNPDLIKKSFDVGGISLKSEKVSARISTRKISNSELQNSTATQRTIILSAMKSLRQNPKMKAKIKLNTKIFYFIQYELYSIEYTQMSVQNSEIL